MPVSLFSDAATRRVDSYTGPMEPPVTKDHLREEEIGAIADEIRRDVDWLHAACDETQLSLRLVSLVHGVADRLERLPARDDTTYMKIVRELVRCMDKSVAAAATREVDARADDCDGNLQ